MDAFNEYMNGLIANVTIVSGQAIYRRDYANGILSEDKHEFSTYAFAPEIIINDPNLDIATIAHDS